MRWERCLLILLALACLAPAGCASTSQHWNDFKEWRETYLEGAARLRVL